MIPGFMEPPITTSTHRQTYKQTLYPHTYMYTQGENEMNDIYNAAMYSTSKQVRRSQ